MFYFLLLKQGSAITNSENHLSIMPSGEFVGNVSGLPRSSDRQHVRPEKELVQVVHRNSICEASDDSDSEIFRVKRRSSAKVLRKVAHDSVSINAKQQV